MLELPSGAPPLSLMVSPVVQFVYYLSETFIRTAGPDVTVMVCPACFSTDNRGDGCGDQGTWRGHYCSWWQCSSVGTCVWRRRRRCVRHQQRWTRCCKHAGWDNHPRHLSLVRAPKVGCLSRVCACVYVPESRLSTPICICTCFGTSFTPED